MPRTALVTGGAGFIGSHLCDRLLADRWAVRALDDLSTGSRENLADGVTLLEGDVCDPEACARACEGTDTVFHLAARVTIRHSVETFLADAQTNLMGTLRLLRAAGAAGVRRFILASSMAVYADAPDPTPVPETHPTEPLSPYGISKLAAEKYIMMMGPRLGLEPVVLRFFNTYGTRQKYSPYVGVATIFVTRILEGKPCLIFGDGEQCRDFIHVADIVAACTLAADAPKAVGQALNVGTGAGTSVNQLAEMIRQALGRGEFGHVDEHPAELRYSVACVDKARELLGYEPKGVLAERIAEVVDYVSSQVGGCE